ncbi:MAG: four helix bundle protein [Chitinophagaceae bacterium]
MSYKDFFEMPVWKQASKIVEDVYALCLKLPKSEDFALSSQLKRAALSIPSNIAEAFGRHHTTDKINFYYFARGSAYEVRSHLAIASKLKFFSENDIKIIEADCCSVIESINKIIKGFRNRPPQP